MNEPNPVPVSTEQPPIDFTIPESQRQYDLRQLANRLPPRSIYAIPNVWGDVAYWMDL